jgi:hypothetical protein
MMGMALEQKRKRGCVSNGSQEKGKGGKRGEGRVSKPNQLPQQQIDLKDRLMNSLLSCGVWYILFSYQAVVHVTADQAA